MTRELVVLGTASQAPTRLRNHNGYLLRWDGLGILFDPGEGTQRQLLQAGERTAVISHIAITHRHGDHLLGLTGVLARMALEQRTDPVVLVHPADASEAVDHLLALVTADPPVAVHRHVLPDDTTAELALDAAGTVLQSIPLDHRVPSIGYRLVEPDRRRVVPDLLAPTGLHGPAVGRLLEEGAVRVDGRVITADEVTAVRPGQSVGVAMDTRSCPAVTAVLADTDLGLVEATYQDGEEALAQQYGHMTADQAGRHGAQAGCRRLVLTHFSQRHPDPDGFAQQAGRHHPDVVVAHDLARIAVPPRVRAEVAG
jgi:ribonuclease Z